MPRLLVRGGICVLIVAVGLLGQPGQASAHPALVGRWSAPLPPGSVTGFIFMPGEFIGHGVWRGPVQILVNDCVVSGGTWELRMYTGTDGTIGIMDAFGISNTVGNIDLGGRIFSYRNVQYKP